MDAKFFFFLNRLNTKLAYLVVIGKHIPEDKPELVKQIFPAAYQVSQRTFDKHIRDNKGVKIVQVGDKQALDILNSTDAEII